ncbi:MULTISPECIES: ABC transporter permease [unclassified Pseudonocardia]|uniref:ABC transporter permease n=1 Tax=unclassified Pseudonocardia TaxID=2619320 RepID=UPI0009EA96DE|nr:MULTISPECIES: ABC transporter permease [unclassified Pseudonocardia]
MTITSTPGTTGTTGAPTGPGGPGPAPRTGRRRRLLSTLAAGLVVPLLLLVGWHLLATSGRFSPAQLPTPLEVVAALGELAGRGELWQHIAISVQRVLLGFAAGAGIGLVLGGLVGLSARVRTVLGPTVQALRAVPSLAWVPLLLLWLGIGETPKVTLVAIGAFFPVYTTVAAALEHVDSRLVEVGRAYGRSGLRLFLQVQLPAIAPPALSGLRLGLAQGWLFLVAAELIASSIGLGFLLIDSQNTGRTDVLLLAIVLLALLGKATDAVLGVAERALLRRWT